MTKKTILNSFVNSSSKRSPENMPHKIEKILIAQDIARKITMAKVRGHLGKQTPLDRRPQATETCPSL